MLVDPESMLILDVNDTAADLLGEPASQLVGRPRRTVDLVLEEAPEQQTTGLYSRGEARDVPALLCRADGSTVPVSWHLLRIAGEDRRYCAEVLFDSTVRKGMQRRRAVAHRLESIGSLAAGVAHEINTPVQYVGDSVRFLEEAGDGFLKVLHLYRALDKAAPATAEVEAVRARIAETVEDVDLDFLEKETPKAFVRSTEGLKRIADIVSVMKKFSHPGGADKQPFNVNRALEDTAMLARNEWKYAAELEMDLDAALPLLPAHGGDLNQVFLNLLVNAAHAVAEKHGESGRKGKITISSRLRGDMAEISFRDNGPGVPEILRDKIFDPFFTTKEVGKGTGQGLALALNIIVEKHGGALTLESAPDGGAAFVVTLPLTGETAGAGAGAADMQQTRNET